MMWSLPDQLPTNLFRYVFAVSWRHQIALIGLTVIAFLLEIVPLEIQRRVVNNLVKERPFQLVIVLCAAYAGTILIQGATKLGLNVYRGWVGENAPKSRISRQRGLTWIGFKSYCASPTSSKAPRSSSSIRCGFGTEIMPSRLKVDKVRHTVSTVSPR